ncbi:MAG: GNAT family N-acetyltransferase [Rhizobiales bacterium]|nr:GNAT family N-acetyltransferase [Hyphomicrobiales bacterium]
MQAQSEPDPLSGLPVGTRVDTTPAARPAAVTLAGRFGRVEKLEPRHAADLWAATQGQNALWPYMSYGPFADEAAFATWIAERAALADPFACAIVAAGSGRAVGVAALMEIRPAARVVEVGHVLYSPALQRTPLATEAQYLLARHVFETLGYRRYEWKCHALNAPSRRAAARYGFTYEGTFRQHMIVKGRNRDTAWFAMLDHEWPGRKAAFEAWLAPENFAADGTQTHSLSSFRRAADEGLEGMRKVTLADRPAVEAHMIAAFTPNKLIMGFEPLPVLADYGDILATHEAYVVERGDAIEGALILLPRADDLYVWGIATAPSLQRSGIGNRMLAAAEIRARALGRSRMRLRTGEKMVANVTWYQRHGFTIESVEDIGGRRVVHMVKTLD